MGGVGGFRGFLRVSEASVRAGLAPHRHGGRVERLGFRV